MLLEIKVLRSRDETIIFKKKSIVVREKIIVNFIRLGLIKREINWYLLQVKYSTVKTLGFPTPNYFLNNFSINKLFTLNYSFKLYS